MLSLTWDAVTKAVMCGIRTLAISCAAEAVITRQACKISGEARGASDSMLKGSSLGGNFCPREANVVSMASIDLEMRVERALSSCNAGSAMAIVVLEYVPLGKGGCFFKYIRNEFDDFSSRDV